MSTSEKESETKEAVKSEFTSSGSTLTDDNVLQSTIWEFTSGIPRRELKMMIAEADECEKDIQEEIELLQDALKKGTDEQVDPKVRELVESPFTPMDRHWTLSALLGRLRGELSPPTLVSVQANNPAPPPPLGATYETARQLLAMRQQAAYTRPHPTPTTLLPTWKKIFSNRLAIVFKKAVRDEDAPGYSDRIKFPMDLSLVRKLIVSRHCKSLADLHMYLGLIAHNCVKYNGRETEYGIVAREFEQMADDIIRQAVWAEANAATPVVPPATAATAAITTTTETPNAA